MLKVIPKKKQNLVNKTTTMKKQKPAVARVMNKFKCTYCPATYSQSIMLDKHLHVHMNQLFHKCVYCDQLFALKEEMEKHQILIHTGPMPFSCSYCDYNFPEERDLIEHELKAHSTKSKSKNSSSSIQSSSSPHKNLVPRKHAIKKSTTTTLIPHKNPKLIKSEKNESGKQKSLNPNSKECPICKTWVARLRPHMNIHSRLKTWFCSYCNREFNQRSNMLRHENIHTGAIKYPCPNTNCTKIFKDQGSFNYHIASKKCLKKQ